MRRLLKRLHRSEHGIAAAEFALIAPVLFTFVIGIAQLGILFMANAGLKNAVGEGARYATLYPRPTDTQIQARISASERFGLDPRSMVTPTITHGVSNGANYVDISASYTVRLNFVLFSMSPFNITENRRAFIQPIDPNANST